MRNGLGVGESNQHFHRCSEICLCTAGFSFAKVCRARMPHHKFIFVVEGEYVDLKAVTRYFPRGMLSSPEVRLITY